VENHKAVLDMITPFTIINQNKKRAV